MADTSEPIQPRELDALFAPLDVAGAGQRFALAVSGGSDSTALMVLLAEWLRLHGQSSQAFTVITVDHCLRAEAGAEARAVGRQAAALGFGHAILRWEGAKPQTGLQAAARAARYRLLGEYAQAHGIAAVVTGHTADDQSETVLMRLARGSGLDGLSAMASVGVLPVPAGTDQRPVRLLRPLLGVRKARLQASLRQRGVSWIEDPSNASPTFERVRLRAARAHLDELGLGVAAIGLSARRLQRARAALEAWVSDLFRSEQHLVHVDPCGFFSIDLGRLRALPHEIVVRLLARAMLAAGGSTEPVPHAGLEAIADGLLGTGVASAWTLARAKAVIAGDRLLIEREPGREPLPHLMLAPGQSDLWDGRFRVAADARLQESVELHALDVEGTRELRGLRLTRDVPASSLRALPGFWRGAELLAVPPLGFWHEDGLRTQLSAVFAFAGNDPRFAP
jgi:tRNA(Ile)-lysidine synthase